MPFWRGSEPGRAVELGRSVGALVRDITEWGETAEEALQEHCRLDERAAGNLARYVREQVESTVAFRPTGASSSVLPMSRTRVCILSPFGGRHTHRGRWPSPRTWKSNGR